MALFLGVAFGGGYLSPFYHHGVGELLALAVAVVFADEGELYVGLVLLSPLEQQALEVFFHSCGARDVDVALVHQSAYELVAAAEASVKVDGAYEGFKGVAAEVAVVGGGAVLEVGAQQGQESYVACDASEVFALYEFAAHGAEEAFVAGGVVVVKYVADNGFYHCIAEVLEALVVVSLG